MQTRNTIYERCSWKSDDTGPTGNAVLVGRGRMSWGEL